MGLYDRDYMREKSSKSKIINFNKSKNFGNKCIIAIILAFILGLIIGKIL